MQCLSPLLICPEELIAKVASYIPDKDQLLTLALTSTQLHRITAESLYRDRHLQLGRVASNYDLLQNLTIRFLSRPDLAACVKHLSIRGEWTAEWERTEFFDITTVHPVVRSAIHKLTKNKRERRIWLNHILDKEKEEALVVVLISALPRLLRMIDTDLPFHPGPHFSWMINEVASGNRALLQHLRDVVFTSSCRSSTYSFGSIGVPLDVSTIEPVIRLPSLRRLFLYDIGNRLSHLDDSFMDELELSPSLKERRVSSRCMLSKVEHLEIRNSHLQARDVYQMILGCHALQTFILEEPGGYDWNSYECRLPIVVSALSEHAGTLKNLCFTSVFSNTSWTAFPNSNLCLHKLYSVEHLKIFGEYLSRAPPVKQLLPPTIRSLIFDTSHSCSDSFLLSKVYSALQPVLLDKSVEFPFLEEIKFLTDAKPSLSSELRQLAADNGIKLKHMVFDSGMKVEGAWGMDQDIRWADVMVNRKPRSVRWGLREAYPWRVGAVNHLRRRIQVQQIGL